MKKHLFAGPRVRILAAGLLVCVAGFHTSFACRRGGAALDADYKGRILKATDMFVGPPDPSMTREKVTAALLEILDLVGAMTPANQYRQEILSRIATAKELMEKDSIFNDKARQYLSFAYRMMTDGKKFEPPKELEVFVTPAELQGKMQKYFRDLVATSLQVLDSGRPGETAKLLLEMVLMVMTPVNG
jgi:hypothetical protein